MNSPEAFRGCVLLDPETTADFGAKFARILRPTFYCKAGNTTNALFAFVSSTTSPFCRVMFEYILNCHEKQR